MEIAGFGQARCGPTKRGGVGSTIYFGWSVQFLVVRDAVASCGRGNEFRIRDK